jgi:polyphosphate glucokinase
MKVLTIDIGGNNVKILATGQETPRRFRSGPTLTPRQMVSNVKKLARDWEYDAISIGYPGRVQNGHPAAEPNNLAPGWVGFDFATAFGRPVKLMNDAAMQALGSYNGGTMLFMGLGTGLGAALVVEGTVLSMEWGHLSYGKGTVEDYVGNRGLKRLGKKKWTRHVTRGVAHMIETFHVEDVVVGGGNAKKLKYLPQGSRAGNNSYAFFGGFRVWEDDSDQQLTSSAPRTLDIAAGREKTREPRKWRFA